MPKAGLEPAQPCDRGILNPLRLPFPPLGLILYSLQRNIIAYSHRFVNTINNLTHKYFINNILTCIIFQNKHKVRSISIDKYIN